MQSFAISLAQTRLIRFLAIGVFTVAGLITAGTVRAQICGNHIREAGEQCDDPNNTNLDGCSATCSFEQIQRINYFKLQTASDTFCTSNAFGGAITSTGLSSFQASIDSALADGSQSLLLEFLGLDDLSGTSDANLQLGVLNATPQSPNGSYDGTSDLDWWYAVDPLTIDASRNPLETLSASIAAQELSAGPGTVTLNLILAGAPAVLSISSARLQTSIGTSSTPMSYVYGSDTDRGHLYAENLDPLLQSFESMGQPTTTGAGKMCGNISAQSLSLVPVPAAMAAGGSTACSQNYSASSNSMLDVLVGGCTVLGFFVVITPTQPDQVDPAMPVAGAGGPYQLSENSQHQVTTCRDKNNTVVTLSTCLAAAAYSSFFKFTTDRVIATNADPILYDTIFQDGFGF